MCIDFSGCMDVCIDLSVCMYVCREKDRRVLGVGAIFSTGLDNSLAAAYKTEALWKRSALESIWLHSLGRNGLCHTCTLSTLVSTEPARSPKIHGRPHPDNKVTGTHAITKARMPFPTDGHQ